MQTFIEQIFFQAAAMSKLPSHKEEETNVTTAPVESNENCNWDLYEEGVPCGEEY